MSGEVEVWDEVDLARELCESQGGRWDFNTGAREAKYLPLARAVLASDWLAARVASAAAEAWDEGWEARCDWIGRFTKRPTNPHRAALSVPTEAEGTS